MESKVVSQTCLFRASSPEELVRVQLLFSVGAAPGSFSWVMVVGRGWHGVCLEISRISKFTRHGPLPREVLPPSVWLSAHLAFKLSLHEVETRSSQCGLKGSCAVCKTRSTKEGLLPSGSQQRASQAAGCACLQTCPWASLPSPQCCADQLRCLTAAPLLFLS